MGNSSTRGAESHSVWNNCTPCKHGHWHYRVTKVKHVSVQFLPGWVEASAATGKWITYVATLGIASQVNGGIKNPTHDVIEIYYTCDECFDKKTMTAEFSKKGKEISYGYYRKDYGTRSDTIYYDFSKNKDFTVEKCRKLYDEMRGSGYSLIDYNCAHWAFEFRRKIMSKFSNYHK